MAPSSLLYWSIQLIYNVKVIMRQRGNLTPASRRGDVVTTVLQCFRIPVIALIDHESEKTDEEEEREPTPGFEGQGSRPCARSGLHRRRRGASICAIDVARGRQTGRRLH